MKRASQPTPNQPRPKPLVALVRAPAFPPPFHFARSADFKICPCPSICISVPLSRSIFPHRLPVGGIQLRLECAPPDAFATNSHFARHQSWIDLLCAALGGRSRGRCC